jgi:hypothetical protein
MSVREGDIAQLCPVKNKGNAYIGMKGRVCDLNEEGSFAIETGTASLIISGYTPHGKRKGVWLLVNGLQVFHRFNYAADRPKLRTFNAFVCYLLGLFMGAALAIMFMLAFLDLS